MSGEFSAAESRALSLTVVSLALVALACAGKPANFNQVSKQTVDQHGSSSLYLLPKSTQEEKWGLQSSLGGILQVGRNTEGDLLALVEDRVRLHVHLRLLPLSSHVGFEFQGKALHMRGVLIHYHSEQAATVRQIFDIAAGSSFLRIFIRASCEGIS